jgi:predicted ArsR family transcriptional regulator
MNARTRHLVRLLADDITGVLIAACAVGPKTAAELAKVADAAPATVASHLELLQAYGLVASARQSTGKPGRPAIVWSAINGELYDRFDAAAVAFSVDLARAVARKGG